MSVCWYLNNRLGASALLSGSTAHDVIVGVNAAPPRWPAPLSRPSLPSCAEVVQRDDVLLTAHPPGLPDVEAVGNFAACNGQQTVYNGEAAVLATQELADTIGRAALLPLVFDYTPLTR